MPVYLGPLIVLGLGHRFILRILRLAKAQNITSIADFVAARYGKSQPVAALVATIAVIGAVPYIALQLKAISNSLTTVLGSTEPGGTLLPEPASATCCCSSLCYSPASRWLSEHAGSMRPSIRTA